ncbi:DUF3152 domain-containing protein [Streptomyces sp. NPDC005551]|uniref:DUF3152 domain-containing protein n=1 Tax=Streptomyces sp. NPDC005551 TaxID=3364725 RepID=UPI00367DAC16
MGRHSRRGRADKDGAAGGKAGEQPAAPRVTAPVAGAAGRAPGAGTPPRGMPRMPQGTPPQGVPRLPDGTPAHGVPRFPDGTPPHGVPRFSDGTPAHGVPLFSDGTPAHGVPRFPDGMPGRGVPRLDDGTPARGVPTARGGHPESRETGGGWGELRMGAPAAAAVAAGQGTAPAVPRTAPLGVPRGMPQGEPPAGRSGPRVPAPRREARRGGPRQAYLDAFGGDDGDLAPGGTGEPPAGAAEPDTGAGRPAPPEKTRNGKGWTFAGIAAAAVTTVLAVVVAGQAAAGREDGSVRPQAAGDGDRDARDFASRGDHRPTPSVTPSVVPLTYDQKMGEKYALGAKLKGPGKFDAVLGFDKAPGKGRKYTYRVDVEQGLGLDPELFAQAVQKTLNDDRSWAHGGARTFERISSGKPDFVITLASPGTTAEWCAKSGLDTTEDNVSCDSAATERVMINAYRWARGSKTYGDRIHSYRQMLINHEVGHRLGFGHVTCGEDGDLAPVMQQQTKFLDHDGIHCKANPWQYPGS